MKDVELDKLFTIEAFLSYAELPDNYREGWSPSYGLHFEETCINEEQKIPVYISVNGKLKKRYPSIQLNIRNVKHMELDYRRKRAMDEAIANSQKITAQLCP